MSRVCWLLVVVVVVMMNSCGSAYALPKINKQNSAILRTPLRQVGPQPTGLPLHSVVANHSGEEVEGGDATISTSIFNLAKSIIGAGVLSLPSGVAFFSSDPKALIPSSIICAVFGLAAAYSFSSIGKVCRDTKSKSFQEAWANTVNPKTAWMISASITAMCFLASLAYSIIIGDSFTALAQVSFLAIYLSFPFSLFLSRGIDLQASRCLQFQK